MDNEKKKVGLGYYINITLIIMLFILLFLFHIANYSLFITIFVIAIIFFITDVVMPFINYIKNEHEYTFLGTFLTWIKIVSIILSLVSIWSIYVDKSYNLYFPYIILIITFVLLLVLHGLEGISAQYKKKMEEEKKTRKPYIVMISIITLIPLCISIINLTIFITAIQNEVFIQQVQEPESVTVYETDIDKYGQKKGFSSGFSFNDTIRIDKQEDLQVIIQDLKQIKTKSLNIIELLNYYKMREDNHPYFLLSFWYDKDARDDFDKGYIDFIVITSNRQAVIERIIYRERSNLIVNLFTRIDKREVYPIELSQEAFDIIFSYINK